MKIISREELLGEGKQETSTLPDIITCTINGRLKKGIREGKEVVTISSSSEVIRKSIFNNRKEIQLMLEECGYTVSTNYDDLASVRPDNGWSLKDRPFESFPEAYSTRNIGVPTRGEITYLGFRMWVHLRKPYNEKSTV